MRGFVCGAFDLLHAGHVHLLKECKKKCDYLIVGLQIDPNVERLEKNRPIESVLERQIKLAGSSYVDEIIVYETEADLIKAVKFKNIEVRFLGSDYKDTDKYITDLEVPIIYIDSIDIHSSRLRERIKNS